MVTPVQILQQTVSNSITKVDPNSREPSYLHWVQTNLTLSVSNISIGSLAFHPLLSTTPPLAPYTKPQPPPGTGRHRYIEFLFSQPANFFIPADYARFFNTDLPRTSFNITNFARDVGLANPVAANYFFAENSTVGANQTAGTEPGSASGTGTGGSVQGELSFLFP